MLKLHRSNLAGWPFYVRAKEGILFGGDTGGMTICSGRVGPLHSKMNFPGIWISRIPH